jgi:hypothetical protein
MYNNETKDNWKKEAISEQLKVGNEKLQDAIGIYGNKASCEDTTLVYVHVCILSVM